MAVINTGLHSAVKDGNTIKIKAKGDAVINKTDLVIQHLKAAPLQNV